MLLLLRAPTQRHRDLLWRAGKPCLSQILHERLPLLELPVLVLQHLVLLLHGRLLLLLQLLQHLLLLLHGRLLLLLLLLLLL